MPFFFRRRPLAPRFCRVPIDGNRKLHAMPVEYRCKSISREQNDWKFKKIQIDRLLNNQISFSLSLCNTHACRYFSARDPCRSRSSRSARWIASPLLPINYNFEPMCFIRRADRPIESSRNEASRYQLSRARIPSPPLRIVLFRLIFRAVDAVGASYLTLDWTHSVRRKAHADTSDRVSLLLHRLYSSGWKMFFIIKTGWMLSFSCYYYHFWEI